MTSESALALAQAKAPSYLEAPAGYGKTETIAEALLHCEGKQLILTHTHAGVDSLRSRIKARSIKNNSYRLETISAWCLRFASAYPSTSGYVTTDVPVWKSVYEATERLLAISGIRQIIQASYSGLIVDEYQDCSEAQHRVLEAVCAILPVRIVGDPLQGIFGFKGERLVDWDKSIYPQYIRLPELTTAWRWSGHNVALGEWLQECRTRLKVGQLPNYEDASVTFVKAADEPARRKAIGKVRPAATESLLVLVKLPNQAHSFAQKFPGFSSMEEIECRELRKACESWFSKAGSELMLEVLDFVQLCCTAPNQDLGTVRKRLADGQLAGIAKLVPKTLTEKLETLGESMALDDAIELCFCLARLNGRRMYRRELFRAMIQTLRLNVRKPELGLIAAGRQVRERVSHGGRKEVLRQVSRVLLVKGLQYDHVIVLDPEELSTCELYVALTRACKSLTVIQGPPKKAAKSATQQAVDPSALQGGQGSLFDSPWHAAVDSSYAARELRRNLTLNL